MASYQITPTARLIDLWDDADLDDCEPICIDHRENICTICAKPYPHHKRFLWADNDKTIKTVELITAHAGCRSILTKIEEQKQKLLDLEYKLYTYKTN
jgi:hypothetical protein